MFEIPDDKLPEFAKDEQKLSVLFAPLRNRTVNPRDWDNKISSWKKLISLYCLCNEQYSFTFTSLNNVFVKSGRPPACLKDVLMQMLKDGDIQSIDNYLVKTSSTWSGWAAEVLVKKPLTWSFNKLKNAVFTNTDDITYVDVDLIKTKSHDIVNKLDNGYINKVLSLHDLLHILDKPHGYIPNLKLLLHNLSVEKKVDIHIANTKNNEESYLVKVYDVNKVNPINEVDIGLYSLEKNETLLTKHIEKLEEEIYNLQQQAKQYLLKGHRHTAKTCLRKKHEIEKRITKKANALHNVQILLEQIKDTHTDAHVWESYKLALESFNTTFKETNMSEDNIEDTMIKLGEVLDIHADIQTALSRPTGDLVNTSDTELEEELAELLKVDNEFNDGPPAGGIEEQLDKLNISVPDLDTSQNASELEATMI